LTVSENNHIPKKLFKKSATQNL